MKKLLACLLLAALCLCGLAGCAATMVGVSVPAYNNALDDAKETVKKANYRAAKAAAKVKYLADGETEDEVYYTYHVEDDGSITVTKGGSTDAPASENDGCVKVPSSE